MKVLLVIDSQDRIDNFSLRLASPADTSINPTLVQSNQQTIILVDLGFRDKQGGPERLKRCQHKTWSERIRVARLYSQLTRYLGAKRRNHRTEQSLQAW